MDTKYSIIENSWHVFCYPINHCGRLLRNNSAEKLSHCIIWGLGDGYLKLNDPVVILACVVSGFPNEYNS